MTKYLNYQCVLYNRSAMVLISLKCILNPVLKNFNVFFSENSYRSCYRSGQHPALFYDSPEREVVSIHAHYPRIH